MNFARHKFFVLLMLLFAAAGARAQKTEKIFLSGTGSDHTVNWQFFCTAGRNSGKWTTIPVPSNWELQGFGKYNYGLDKDSLKGREQGLYKYQFDVPVAWEGKDINIVFDGSMSDTEVKINGQSAGSTHQGSFYRFKYNITRLLHYGKPNLLEVTVSKYSANSSVNDAERKGDFWVFGGIFRPVFLEVFPKQHIRTVAVDAKADGSFKAQLKLSNIVAAGQITGQFYSISGQKVGMPFAAKVNKGDSSVMISTHMASPKLWSPEFPNLYKVVFMLSTGGKLQHTVDQRFGFRTIELREHDGIYVNNVKIKFKGVNRHSFWPTTGRALNKTRSIADVKMIKDMNMNAVRMSHYPPDDHFLDACDSLGLFVLDELTGWHHIYNDTTGTKLVHEMIEKDVNHPSIVIWDNGNEGGFNFDLDHWFDDLDIQKRPLIHPWTIFRGTNTQHYVNYDYGTGTGIHGHDVFFPTEFLHGLYDGGAGAGLDDFWEQMWHTPISAGGFIWVFADEDVVRTDKDNKIDGDGDHAPDGIVGPYHEKEGSYYTIKEIWCPVHLQAREITPQFNGKLQLENRYHFTNLKQCTFKWSLKKLGNPYQRTSTLAQAGVAVSPDVAPGQYGVLDLKLPAGWQNFDVLYLTAIDPHHNELYTWSWPIVSHQKITDRMVTKTGGAKPQISETDSLYRVKAGGLELEFKRSSGILAKVKYDKGEIPLTNGPVLAETGAQAKAGFLGLTHRYEGDNLIVEASFGKKTMEQMLKWTIYPSGWVQLDVKYWPIGEEADMLGVSFSFPERDVKGVTYMGNGPYRVWKNRMKGVTLNVWNKTYNNTITGNGEVTYPEFKGYYSNFYWMKLQTTGQPVTIVCDDQDVFMRLFTPANPAKTYNVAPAFPTGDISFMHGITPIGTKSQKADKIGTAGFPNKYFDYDKNLNMALSLTLYFDFSGK